MTDETLERGTEGSDVKELQESLIELRFKPGATDGVFGPLTESAVKMFQVTVNVASDGVVGPITREKLDEASGDGASE